MAKLLASVLIDTYNHERFIEQALTSVLEQDFPMADVEILVVDDGSTDRTPEIVKKFEPRIRLIRKANGGQASAFNCALPQTRGEIIAMLDGDDRWAPQKLKRAAETLERNPDVGIVGHGHFEVYDDGRPDGLVLPGKVYSVDLSNDENAELFRHLAGFFGTSKMTIRKSLLDRILPIPEDLVIEADEYIFTLAPALGRAMVLNEPLFYYGFHPGNLFQFENFDPVKVRRKIKVLKRIVLEVPPVLRTLGVAESAIQVLFSGRNVEIERLELSVEGGSSIRTFRVEQHAYRLAYREVTYRHWLFHALVMAQALLLPPRVFYRLRRLYAKKQLSTWRRWTGDPVPVVQFREDRPSL